MRIVKDAGPIVLAEEDGKYFFIREGKERSQEFDSEQDSYDALKRRNGKAIRWQ